MYERNGITGKGDLINLGNVQVVSTVESDDTRDQRPSTKGSSGERCNLLWFVLIDSLSKSQARGVTLEGVEYGHN